MQFQSTQSNQAMQRLLALGTDQNTNATPATPSVVQRQATGSTATASTATPAAQHQLRDSYENCNELPHVEADVRKAVRTAYTQIEQGGCIQNQALRDDLLTAYDGITIRCSQDAPEDKCAEARGSHTLNLYKTAYMTNKCPSQLAASIFHESVHLIQSVFEPHGSLSWDCQEACFPGSDEPHRGTASGCNYERGRLPFVSLSTGLGFAGSSTPTRYFRVYAGYEKRRWLASYLDFSAGIAVSYIGETESGEPGDISGSSKLVSLMTALRLDPGEMGGPYGSISAGPSLAIGGSKKELGAEVGVGVGMRWRVVDLSVNVGLDFDPTRKAGMDKIFTAAATLTLTPGVRR
jgi:hypothetical protein